MKRLQAYKFELRGNGNQTHALSKAAGSCRFVWNWALGLRKEVFELGVAVNYFDLAGELVDLKADLTWLADVPSQALQQSLKDLDRAYKNFFAGRADFPRFKKRGIHDSLRYPQGFKLNEGQRQVFLPKVGWVKYRRSRFIEGTIKNMTVSKVGVKWFVSIQTEREVADPVHESRSMVGYDLGVKIFATGSDGTRFEPASPLKMALPKIARLQRSMARKVQFSSNWRKANLRLGNLHRQVSRKRGDFLHKVSSTISKNHAVIVLEDLKVGNMSRGAQGSLACPGTNVRAKSGLNRAILDQGWGEFRRQLDYKSQWRGGQVIVVDHRNTSRTCCDCGHVSADNRKTQSQFKCVAC